jgi:hypothetical protein
MLQTNIKTINNLYQINKLAYDIYHYDTQFWINKFNNFNYTIKFKHNDSIRELIEQFEIMHKVRKYRRYIQSDTKNDITIDIGHFDIGNFKYIFTRLPPHFMEQIYNDNFKDMYNHIPAFLCFSNKDNNIVMTFKTFITYSYDSYITTKIVVDTNAFEDLIANYCYYSMRFNYPLLVQLGT